MDNQSASVAGGRDNAPVAAVMGGGGGIGLGIAQAYARRGYRVALVDFDPQRLAQAQVQLGGGFAQYLCDLTDESAVSAVLPRLAAEHGRLDVLVHAAGLTHVSRFDHTELSVIRRVMEVNFFAVAHATQMLLPALEKSRGRIVVLSSVCGFAPLVGRTGYCASKYALHGFFEALRCETAAHGVSVTMICPSFVDTDFATRGLAGDGSRLAQARTTSGAMLDPQALGERVYRAAQRRRRLLVLSRQGQLSYWISRLAPGLYQRLMARRFREILGDTERR